MIRESTRTAPAPFPGIDRERSFTIMGVVNVTPDSFSDGGKYFSPSKAIEHGLLLAEQGARIIDVGGESSRPGSFPISAEEEADRVLPVIEGIHRVHDVILSIDTMKSSVARLALRSGAKIVNDISAMTFDPEMADVAVTNDASVILMHMQGTPRTMQIDPVYHDVVREVKMFLEDRVHSCRSLGIESIAIDPGIGFGKRIEDNLTLLRKLESFVTSDVPLVVGTSRKSFLGSVTGKAVDARLAGSIASALLAWMKGASILRVHDVEDIRDALLVAEAISTGRFYAV